jgi:hypothetical protein
MIDALLAYAARNSKPTSKSAPPNARLIHRQSSLQSEGTYRGDIG